MNEIVETAHTSMGMVISDLDLLNIERFAARVAPLTEYRGRLHEYIKERMQSCAPSLTALIGEQVSGCALFCLVHRSIYLFSIFPPIYSQVFLGSYSFDYLLPQL